MNSCFLAHERSSSNAFLFPTTKDPDGSRFPLVTLRDGLLQLKGKSHEEICVILEKVAHHLEKIFDGVNYQFNFIESVSRNGWWLTCDDTGGKRHLCRITLWDEEGSFVG